ncbi:DUF3368 domain-containing protein [Halomicroarcula sp. GCM10025817]|uniref:DUF3368 domain-containing protein n=1 Tax=Haloarcula TaxID=2237 RepID=UPI0023E78724|nr:DUF3368 domain-containing protein [Halomicroarcula sp. SYNS111]
MSSDPRTLFVDASVFITLAAIDAVELLSSLRGESVVPTAVRAEVRDDPARTQLATLLDENAPERATGDVRAVDVYSTALEMDAADVYDDSARRLGKDPDETVRTGPATPASTDGDVALLTAARLTDTAVILTDDKPLRNTCQSLSIPVSGTIGILVRAVETGALEPNEAKTKLYAMDDVGARLSASLVRRAETLLDDAGD